MAPNEHAALPDLEQIKAIVDDLTADERIEVARQLRAVLAELPPASGPLDAGLRADFEATAQQLEHST